jgi:hypothetical protein
MSAFAGPARVTNGLVFDYDMSNNSKSWIGRPSTNTCNYDTYNYTDGNATVTRGATPPIPTPVPGFEISKIQSNNGADTSMNILYTSSVDQVNGGVYTHSAWILLTAGTYCRVGQHWNPWDAGSAQYIPLNVWTRVSYTLTNGTNNYGNIANAYGTDGTIYVTAVQYEQGSTATPFMGGAGASRSSGQALVDLVGKNTITASSLTYAGDGTFSFNGSSNFINLNNNIQSGYTSASYEFWCRPTSLPGSGNYFQLYIQESSTWIALYNIGSGAFFGIDLNNGSGWFDNNGGSNTGARTTTALTSNTDYHVAYSWNGSTVSVYLNGNLQATVSTLQAANGRQNVTQLGTGTTSRNIGSRYNGTNNNWVGTINSVRFYNQALSANEVLQNFNATRSRYGL